MSEEIIGKAIKKYNFPRHKLTILTKCFGYVGETPDLRTIMYRTELPQLKDYVNQGGLSRAAIFNSVEASLKRLDIDYIDLLQIHRFDPTVPIEETMEALHDLVKSGKVRYIGASSMWAVEFAQMQFVAEKNGWTKFVSMQNHYNLLYREEEREMIRFCNSTGVGLIPVSHALGYVYGSQLISRSGRRFAAVILHARPPRSAKRYARAPRSRQVLPSPGTRTRTRRPLIASKSWRRSEGGA